MEYIYDIILNFQDEYYEFYEWLPSDKIINVKRIPIYKVSIDNYLSIKNNEVIIDRKSLPKQNKIFLITTGSEVMGILIDNTGKVMKKSSLLFEESDDILTDKDDIKRVNIKYTIEYKKKPRYKSRISTKKYEYINNYLNNLDKINDEYLLKYIYYEIYNNEEKSIEYIYNKLIELSTKNPILLYDSIKKVTNELKK